MPAYRHSEDTGGRLADRPIPGRSREPPRTDIGTLLLHWVTALAFLVSAVTGLRIASDDLDAVVTKWLIPVLPQGELWTWHFFAGLVLFFGSSAYAGYMLRSGLLGRIALKKLRLLTIPGAGRLRYDALNVLLHWMLYVIVLVLGATGIFLFLGYGGWLISVHLAAASLGVIYVFAHLLSHFLFGGLQQWLRVFRPAALISTQAARPLPLLIAGVGGLAVAATLVGIDLRTRGELIIRSVKTPPDMNKLMDDPVWADITPVRIHTSQGANLGGTGKSLVEVRAVHDENNVYFAFRWEDPSRSLRRLPLIKQADGWHLTDDNAFIDDVNTFYEDKFAVIFSPTARFGSGGVAHFGSKPIANEPGSRNGRGLHYTDGPMVDMWQWKPSRGGMLGHVDNMYMAPPRDPTPDEASQLIRYQGGYWGDPGRASYVYNFLPLRPSEYHPGSPVAIRRLPKDYQAMAKAMGHWDPNPDASVDDGSQWWMLEDKSVPYSPEADAKIPVGTIIPGVLIIGDYEGPRAAVTCHAHWQDGHWTLIAKRSLKGASAYDQDFAQGHDLYMWVAVFDHTQTRHTRHPRPVKVVMQ